MPAFVALSVLGAWGLAQLRPAPSVAAVPSRPLETARPTRAASDELRWIVAGGGSRPELNQVQVEQDLVLATQVLGADDGLLLYAGGPGSASVQVLRPDPAPDPLVSRLGELFDPRGGRDSEYRAAVLEPVGAARAEAILEAVRGAIDQGVAPLTVYLAGHGIGGELPRDSRFLTWGAGDLAVEDLVAILDAAPRHRPVRFVMTSCYAGGFAEMAFRDADPESGPAPSDRCGFFATTWDRAASGCDPNPDRAAQEGYGMHFLQALAGRDRAGHDDRPAIDRDRDGSISLLEAHTRARIASGSLDVPVTTSERYLRVVAPSPDEAPLDPEPARLPFEEAVVTELSRRLEIVPPTDVSARLDALQDEVQPLAARLDELEDELLRTRDELVAALLHRWPVLDDPWHPDFASTLADQRGAISSYLEASGLAAQELQLAAEHAEVAAAHDDLLARAAPMERLERALDTLALAARLQAVGGERWERYQRFVACESGWP